MKRTQALVWLYEHRHVLNNLVWVWLGLACIASALTFFFDPATALAASPLHQFLRPWDAIWQVLFAISGVGIIAGLFTEKPHIEAAALMIFAGALTINFLAIVVVVGLIPTSMTYPALIFAAVARAGLLTTVGWLLRPHDPKPPATP